jgi:hypothetical protein
MHTLTGVGDLTIVDGKRHARSFKRLTWGLKQLTLEQGRSGARPASSSTAGQGTWSSGATLPGSPT